MVMSLCRGDSAACPNLLFPMNCGRWWPRCCRRLQEWQAAGVWDKLHRLLLKHLQQADQIDGSRAIVDSGSVRAVGAGKKTGLNPTDRAKAGSKQHLITDGQEVPLAVILTGANEHDVIFPFI